MEPGAWPLVGRQRELAAAVVSLRRHGGVLLAGPAGAGRTRLGLELLAGAVDGGASTLRLCGTSSARATPLVALGPLVGGASPGAGALAAARNEIDARAGRGGLAVLVDDAHLLDDASAALLLQLVDVTALTMVVTTVAGLPAPDAVVALWKDGHLDRVEVALLDDGDVSALVDHALPGAVDGAARRALVEAAAGVPLALREVVLEGVAQGALVQHEGVWRLREALGGSSRLHDLVAGRLDGLSVAAREALEVLAVGQPLGVPVLERLVRTSVLEELEARRLLEVRSDGLRGEARLAPGLTPRCSGRNSSRCAGAG